MKKLFAVISMILIVAFLFSSCSSNSLILPADSLLSPPLFYEEYEELVDSFNKTVESETILCSPRKGDYRSAIVVEDIDSDGVDEAIIFYKNSKDSSVARMNHFDYIDDRWISFGDFNGYGSEVENVVVCDMDKDGKSEVLVLWNTAGASAGNILSVYRADSVNQKFDEICNESCLLSDVIDIDGNGRKDIFLISQNNLQGVNQKVAKAMRLSGGSIALFGETKLDANISSYTSVKTEKISDDSPMRIYVDALKGDQQMITEVIYWDKSKSELCAPLLDSETLTNSLTLRFDPIECRDINNDGIIDIPFQNVPFGKGDSAITIDTENIFITEWKSLSDNGFESVLKTIVNYQDGYMINLDESEINTSGIRNYRSQNCWIVYSTSLNSDSVNELYSVIKVPVSKWNTDKFNAYVPVIEYEDSVVCVFITSEGKKIGIDVAYVKSKIIRIN